MIVSEILKLNINNSFDNKDIENALNEKGITPLRWAVISIEEQELMVSVSYVKEN